MIPAHDLTSTPIPTLIRQISLPVMVGFFFNTMFNVVDTYYGGQISTEALAALSFSFPVFFLVIIFDAGLSTGITALIANALGAKEAGNMRRYVGQSLSFAIIASAFLTILGLLAAPSLFRLLGAEGATLALALEYMDVILGGAMCFMLASVCTAFLQATGDTRSIRNFLVGGFFLNAVLDPWFLYGGWGLPPLGFRGIAVATVLVQLLGALYLYRRATHTGLIPRLSVEDILPNRRTFSEIASQAVPAGLNFATIGIGVFIITAFAGKFGEAVVAAYGIATRIEQLALLPTIGLTVACLSIVGQNNGAKRYDRVRETFRRCLQYGLIIMGLGGVAVFFASNSMMGLFTSDAAVAALGSHYLRIAAFIFLAYAILFVAVSFLQGMKRPLYPVGIGLYRQILAPLVMFPLLSTTLGWGVDGIWWGIFGITWSAALATLFYARYIVRNRVA